MYLINYAFPYLIIRADKCVFNRHFLGFIGSSSGLSPVSKRASRPRFATSVPRVFRIRLINERTTKIPIFRPSRVRPSTALLKVSSKPASGYLRKGAAWRCSLIFSATRRTACPCPPTSASSRAHAARPP